MDWSILYKYKQAQLVEYVTKRNTWICGYAARGKKNTML